MRCIISVDCVWDDWEEWQECSVTCGGGTKKRDRVPIGPFYGGSECQGSTEDDDGCKPDPCPS